MTDALLRSSNGTRYIPDVFITQDLKIYVEFLNATKVKKIIGIAKRLRLRSSKRLTVNVIRNQPAISLAGQQRNRITLDETNIASSQLMEYDFSPLVGLRRSFARIASPNPPLWERKATLPGGG